MTPTSNAPSPIIAACSGVNRVDAPRWEDSAGTLMKAVVTSMIQEIDRRLGEHDLTYAQWLPLSELVRGGCSSVADIIRALRSDSGSTTRAIHRLEAKGLVARLPAIADRRVVRLQPTEAGRRLCAVVPDILAEVLAQHLAGFEQSESRSLLDMLDRIRANADALRKVA